jgi:hypothetical protein
VVAGDSPARLQFKPHLTQKVPHLSRFLRQVGIHSRYPSQKTFHTKWAIRANTTIMNPVIQIRNLAVSFGDSISFLSIASGYAGGGVLPSWARLGSCDSCPYGVRGKKKAAIFYRGLTE